MLSLLRRWKEGTGAPLALAEKPSISICDKEEALWRLLHNPSDHHLIQIYDEVLEPRSFGKRRICEELAIFLICPGNRIDLFTPPETLQKFESHPHHNMLNMLKNRPNARIIPSRLTGNTDFMVGSHGETYIQPRDGIGIFSRNDHDTYTRLTTIALALSGRSESAPAANPQ